MMRFQCSQLVVERMDPLVSPGLEQVGHVHQIVGGNSFNATMTPVLYDPAERSTCTTCSFSEDFSNYWTASIYFQARNGSFKRVPQMVNLGLRGSGGITVYYIPPYDGKTKVTAFRPVSPTSLVWLGLVTVLTSCRVSVCSRATSTSVAQRACSVRSATDASTTSSRTPSVVPLAPARIPLPSPRSRAPVVFDQLSPSRRKSMFPVHTIGGILIRLRMIDVGTARTSTRPTTGNTSPTPAAAASSPPALAQPATPSACPSSCTKSCGIPGSSTTPRTGLRKDSHSSTLSVMRKSNHPLV